MAVKYAIIGGTGVYDPGQVDDARTDKIHTPYGEATVTIGTYAGKHVAFMARHGEGHATPPHRINYRANIWALKEIGVEQVLATAAVGSLQLALAPGELVLVDDVIDMTKSRISTFFDAERVVHVDMSDPYCGRLRQHLKDTADHLGYHVHDGGVYVCTEGPRFETKAEIQMYSRLGGSVVGMTSIPEVTLAKEAELCYATVCMVTNYAAGLSSHPLTHQEVVDTMRDNVGKIRSLFYNFIERDTSTRTCSCKEAVGGQTPLGQEEH
ncbi:S-methyl-5'-thioadenosine phosphorylase [Alicyclobacillus dauci]|uniref:Probable 6-oxopurine nucleoside phosphorylase n=1 Tax=Alicyclobacillus dauci TaxID=1475485 RepID=A0ABY6YX41_9BACL|nr:S-methyl-5'-thioadenosine phosphorylase [Alicyclobacillus dauci]WAH35145.1 S-methyl-5'-thioadenosine phosphorylase [Alicyclobacillus dauci]